MTDFEMNNSSLRTAHGFDARVLARALTFAAAVSAAVVAVAFNGAILDHPASAAETQVSSTAQRHSIDADSTQRLVGTIDWNRMREEDDPSALAIAAYER